MGGLFPVRGHNRRSKIPGHTSGLPLISGAAQRSQLLRLGASKRHRGDVAPNFCAGSIC